MKERRCGDLKWLDFSEANPEAAFMVLAQAYTEADVLDRVSVRLVREDERLRFNQHLEEEHYLESSVLVGEWLRYVAELSFPEMAVLLGKNEAAVKKSVYRLLARIQTQVE